MPLDPRKYLYDMRVACDLVLQFSAGKTWEQYQGDSYFRSAVERQLQILGEALVQLSREHPELADEIPQRRAIISFRNILVHGYDRVEDDVVWGIVQAHVPLLRGKVDALLSSGSP